MILSEDGHRYCQICGKCIDNLHFNCKTCNDPECKKAWNKKVYENQQKICKGCGKFFIGTGHQLYCDDCRTKPDFHKEIFDKSLSRKIIDVICPECGKVMYQEEVYNTRKDKTTRKSDSLCEDYHNKKMKDISDRMKNKNPMKNPEIVKKNCKTRAKKSIKAYVTDCKNKGIEPNIQEFSNKRSRDNLIKKLRKEGKPIPEEYQYQPVSERMRNNNPMKDPKIAKKVGETIKKRIKSGEIIPKKGKDRYNYKGGQKINKALRIALKEWRIHELKRAEYKCEVCGHIGGTLHIHHLEPLKDIIDKFCKKHNVEKKDLNKQLDSDLFKEIIKEIVIYHFEHNIGIVVCPDCHDKIDKHYYKRKNENKKNHQRKFRG